MQREFKLVYARNLHQSTILPQREHNQELIESVKKVGIQTPLIVRLVEGKPGEYEIIDGGLRSAELRDDDQVLVDVRSDVKDSELFKISDATFKRKDRTAYEISILVGMVEDHRERARHG